MAISHIQFDDQSQHGRQLRRALSLLEEGLVTLNDIFQIMTLMKDGADVTAYLQNKFGFPDIPTAEAAYDELNSLQAKLNTNASITDLNAALLQAFHKFG